MALAVSYLKIDGDLVRQFKNGNFRTFLNFKKQLTKEVIWAK